MESAAARTANVKQPSNRAPAGARARVATPPPRKVAATATSTPVASGTSPVALSKNGLDAKVLRAGFMRKVYGLLSAQLSLTVIVAMVCTLSPTVRGILVRTQIGGWLNTLVYWPTVACLLGLRWKKDQYPANYVLLGCLTLCISLDVGMVCSILYHAGLGMLIVQATSITTAMLVCLTVYAIYSGADFSFLKGFLACSLWGLVIGGFLSLLLGIRVMDSALAWFGAAVFSGYILYDTNRVATKFGYDDYIVGTVELYLDIVNLFLHVLRILMKSQGKTNKK